MKRMPKIKYLITVLSAFLLMCGVSITAYASADSPSFTYSYPVDGVTFRLYEVGEVANDELILTGDYADYNVNLLEKTAGETLAAYVERDGLEPIATAVSENGSLTFENLTTKVYLMTGEIVTDGRYKWIPSAILFSVPQQDEETGELIWDIEAGGKYDRIDPHTDKEVAVEKIWKDAGYENKRPESIKVQLLKDGEVYDTVELSKTNNWKYKWNNLDGYNTWTVIEEKVPDNYKVTIKQEKGVTVIENARGNSPTTTPPPSNPHIPYTGQLWWPVGILLVLGIGLILVGLIRRKRTE